MLVAASTDRLLGSWGITPSDPLDVYAASGHNIGARGEWLYDNDAIAHAIAETLVNGIVGPNGLTFRSQYQEDDRSEVNDRELAVRKAIGRRLRSAMHGTRFDAGGVLTKREMSVVTVASALFHGDAWSVRQWLPNRPGRHTHATCWRIIHPMRVCNPGFTRDTETMRQGIELDPATLSPIAVHILKVHPNTVVNPSFVWARVPIFAADGSINVTHHCEHRHPGQLRPVGWYAPVMQLLRLSGRTLEAKVVADTLKASMGLIVECDAPEDMAQADKNGAALTSNSGAMVNGGNVRIVPGRVYYVRKGTSWKLLDFKYEGQDFAAWFDVLLTNICAPFGLPAEFVMQRLTRSNMASSRVALLQAYRTFHTLGNTLIGTTEDPWHHSVILEDLARGALPVSATDDVEQLDRILDGRYSRPAKWLPDPLKEQQAAAAWTKQMGRSFTSAYADSGEEFEDQIVQREQDDLKLAQHNITLESAVAPATVADPEAPADDPAAPGKPAQSDGGDEDTEGASVEEDAVETA